MHLENIGDKIISVQLNNGRKLEYATEFVMGGEDYCLVGYKLRDAKQSEYIKDRLEICDEFGHEVALLSRMDIIVGVPMFSMVEDKKQEGIILETRKTFDKRLFKFYVECDRTFGSEKIREELRKKIEVDEDFRDYLIEDAVKKALLSLNKD